MKTITVLLSVLILSATLPRAFAQDQWTAVAHFGGGVTYNGVGISIGGKGYVGLGTNDTGYTNEFWEYDPVNDVWTQKADFPGGFRYSPTGFTIDSIGYVGTGAYTPGDVGWVWYNDLWAYSPAANTWTQRASFNALGRNGAVGFSMQGKGYIGTGQYRVDRYHPSQYLDDFWRYDPVTDSWQQIASLPEQGRLEASGFAIGNKAYVGLGIYYYDTRLKDWWEYDPLGDEWTQKNDFPGIQRYLADGFTLGDRGYINGGGYYTPLKDLWEYNPELDTWCRKADYPEEVIGSVAFVIDSVAYRGGGSSVTELRSTFYKYLANPLDVVVPDAYAVFPGGEANTIYIGYGPASLTLTAEASGGTPFPDSSYQYLWSDGSTGGQLTVSPDEPGEFVYSVTVTDAGGCMDQYFTTVTVKDVRCGNTLGKVQVCMTTPGPVGRKLSLCLAPAAVAIQLERGATLGDCEEAAARDISVFPNPNNGSFRLEIGRGAGDVDVVVTDRDGKPVMKQSFGNAADGLLGDIHLGAVPPGVYYIQVISGGQVRTGKIFVTD